MARIEHVHHRLERWAMWVGNGRCCPGGGGTLSMFKGEPASADAPQARIPINEEECWKTEEAISRLPDALPETVASYYLLDSVRTRGKLGISASTLSQRLTQAHKLLDAMWLQDRVLSANVHTPPSWCK